MKAVFIGGGAHRLLAILRRALATGVFQDGEIVLCDLNLHRAEVMGRLLMQAPEYVGTGCRISWNNDFESSLEGADAVSVVLMGGSPLTYALGELPAWRYGYYSSDNVSPNGAFLAAKTASLLMRIARGMEKKCPDAWLIDFANPIAPLSGMINRFTKIRALGVCAGFINHQWDLNRLLGRDCWSQEFELKVAGVNHLSFILEGTAPDSLSGGKLDLFKAVERAIAGGWKAPEMQPRWSDFIRGNVLWGVQFMADVYKDLGVLIFSTEMDGMIHLRYEEEVARLRERKGEPSRVSIEAALAEEAAYRKRADVEFAEAVRLSQHGDFWERHAGTMNIFDSIPDDIFVRVLRGISGEEEQEIVCTTLNQGAIADLPAEAAVEFTQSMFRGCLKRGETLSVPKPVYGTVAGLAMHQALLAEACATEDPRLFAKALLAYPVRPYSRALKGLCSELVKINAEELPQGLRRAGEFF